MVCLGGKFVSIDFFEVGQFSVSVGESVGVFRQLAFRVQGLPSIRFGILSSDNLMLHSRLDPHSSEFRRRETNLSNSHRLDDSGVVRFPPPKDRLTILTDFFCGLSFFKRSSFVQVGVLVLGLNRRRDAWVLLFAAGHFGF